MLTGVHIPQEDNIVIIPTDERFTIRTEREASDPTRMPGESPLVLTGFRIPQADGVVKMRTGEYFTIGAEHNPPEPSRIPDGAFVLTSDCIP